LAIQLDVFDDEYEADEISIAKQGTDISAYEDEFKAVYRKVRYLLIYF